MIASHVPACQCAVCKPTLGPALQDNSRFQMFFEVAVTLDAQDYYTAKLMAETLRDRMREEINKSVACDVRVLAVVLDR